jgi:hypothetical protein
MYVVRHPHVADLGTYAFDSLDAAKAAADRLLTAYHGTEDRDGVGRGGSFDEMAETRRAPCRAWTYRGYIAIEEALVGPAATAAAAAKAADGVLWHALDVPCRAPDFSKTRARFEEMRAGGATDEEVRTWYAEGPASAAAAAAQEAKTALEAVVADARAAGLAANEVTRVRAAFKAAGGFAAGVVAATDKAAALKAAASTAAAAAATSAAAAATAADIIDVLERHRRRGGGDSCGGGKRARR